MEIEVFLMKVMAIFLKMKDHGSHIDWKTWENGKPFSSQEKYWKTEGILSKNTGKLREY